MGINLIRVRRSYLTVFWLLFLPFFFISIPAHAAESKPEVKTEPIKAPPKSARPEQSLFDSGRLLATSGVSQVDGAGGGGLVPWAMITGYGTRDAIGANAHYTYSYLRDFELHSVGAAVGLFDRFELSYARMWFDTGSSGGRLGLGDGFTFRQDVFGAKLRVIGDAVYDQDTILPQVSVGAFYKDNNTSNGAVVKSLGARRDNDVEFYVSATKLWLDQSLLLNGTVRMTRANQLGLLGFGGPQNDDFEPQFEGSVAYLVTRRLVIGGEYRMKPDNLSFAEEDDWFDIFAAYFITKNLSATLAYLNAGEITLQGEQQGIYLSIKAGF